MNFFIRFIAFMLLISFIISCSNGDGEKGQSINNGMSLYKTNCSACHQEDGGGLAALYPPLKNSDYLKVNYSKIPCIIRNGLQASIKVNGQAYEQQMLGIASLTPEEITDISNYVMNNFNQMDTYTNAKEVSKTLKTCLP